MTKKLILMSCVIATFYCNSNAQNTRTQHNNSIWTLEVERYTSSEPVISDGVYYIGNEKGSLHAIDIDNGNLLWKKDHLGAMYHDLAIYKKNIIVQNGDHISAFDKKSGNNVWTISPGPESGLSFDDDAYEKMLFIEDKFYINSLDKAVYCFNADDGKEIWRCQLDADPSSVHLVKGKLVCSSREGTVFQIEPKNGKLLDQISTGLVHRTNYVKPVILDESLICLFDTANKLNAFSLEEKKVLWTSIETGRLTYQFGNQNIALLSSREYLIALNSKGEQLWRIDGSYGWYTFPQKFENDIILYNRRQGIEHINANGEILNTYGPCDKSYTVPLVYKKTLIYTCAGEIRGVKMNE